MKNKLKQFWNFVWHDDSLLSLVLSAILIIIFGKFILFPILGALFGTSLPIVAVVSNSMEHNTNFETWWLDNPESSARRARWIKWLDNWGFIEALNN